MNKKVKKITSNFRISGEAISADSYGTGHINDTFLIVCETGSRYILRKINRYVFKRPEIVVRNTRMVLAHLRKSMIEEGMSNRLERTLSLLQTNDGEYSYQDDEGETWCMTSFCKNSFTAEFVENEEQAYQAAKAFGEFQRLIIDAELEKYKPTIPDFHNISKRVSDLINAIEDDPVGRKSFAQKEIEKAIGLKGISDKMEELLLKKIIPLRLTHNDAKISNVLLDKETEKAICVIDLDTIMPGTVLSDFGDMVRSLTSSAAEDETDLDKVFMKKDIFIALAKGYLEEMKDVLTKEEIENLVFGAEAIIYEQAIRFLSDFLIGDKYYKTKYEMHNFDRAKNQFKLLESVQQQKYEMKKIVNQITNIGE